MFVFVIALLTIAPTLGSDFSCNFTKGKCGWFLGGGQRCRWQIKSENSRKSKAYLSLVGAPGCSAALAWTFDSNDVSDTNYISFEYYMVGTGPASLSVANDEDGLNWNCPSIEKGNQKRMMHGRINQKAKYVYIKAKVGAGSELIITQIWNSLLGAQVENVCPPLSPITTTPTIVTTEALTTTRSVSNTIDDIFFESTSAPESITITTQLDDKVTTPGFTAKIHSTTQNPTSFDPTNLLKELRGIIEKFLSTKNHTITVTGNIVMNLKVATKPNK